MLNVNDLNQIYLGCQGENLARTIPIDVKPWLVAHPNGVISLYHKRNGAEEATPTGAVFDAEAGTLTWRPTSTDTYMFGEGEAEIRLAEGSVIKKTRKIKTDVAKAVTGGDGTALESGWQGFIDAIQKAAGVAITKNGQIKFAVNSNGHLIFSYTEQVPVPADDDDTETTVGDITWIDKDLGTVSAFGVARENGWTGTEALWTALQAACPELALKAESFGAGTSNGEELEEGDPAYHNNAPYYAGLAADSAEDAADSAGDAAESATEAAASAEDAAQYTHDAVSDWLNDKFGQITADPPLDRTLSQALAAAPADMVGDLKSAIDDIEHGIFPIDVSWEEGSIDSHGDPVSGPDYRRTVGYIDLLYNNVSIIRGTTGNVLVTIREYTESKEYNNSAKQTTINGSYNYTPAKTGTRYIRIVTVDTVYETIKLLKGYNDEPIENSENLVKSGGIYSAIENKADEIKKELNFVGADYAPATKFPGNLVDASECVAGEYAAWDDGHFQPEDSYFRTGFMPVTPGTSYKSNGMRHLAWYDSNKDFISGVNGPIGTVTAPSSPTAAAYAVVSNDITRDKAYPFLAYFAKTSDYSEKVTLKNLDTDTAFTTVGKPADGKAVGDAIDAVNDGIDNVEDLIETILVKGNVFDKDNSTMKKLNINYATGAVSGSVKNTSICIQVTPSTQYTINIPNATRSRVVENSTADFEGGNTYNVIYNPTQHSGDGNYPITFTVGEGKNYILIDVISGSDYDYDSNKNNIQMSIGTEIIGNKVKPNAVTVDKTLTQENVPADAKTVGDAIAIGGIELSSAQVLVFGDSITDSTIVTYDTSKESQDGTSLTTAVSASYKWRSIGTKKSDTDTAKDYEKDGNTITFYHWPKLLKDVVGFKEIRCYAKSGAYYHTVERPENDQNWKPLFNLQCQIDLAINDYNAHNTIVGAADFEPDIIIFALGTNDILQPQKIGSFDETMAETVYVEPAQPYYTYDVPATIAAIDDSASIGSAHKAFLRVKQVWPNAQIFCVLPLLRTAYDFNQGSFRTELIKIANRYNAIIIDGTYESGVVKDFEEQGQVGVLTIDGLHPNEIGQNMLARLILKTLYNKYTPLYCEFVV